MLRTRVRRQGRALQMDKCGWAGFLRHRLAPSQSGAAAHGVSMEQVDLTIQEAALEARGPPARADRAPPAAADPQAAADDPS